MGIDVREAYTQRAAEYAAHLGTTAVAHPSDLHLVSVWASQVTGPVVDAGCGPGHWTNHLVEQGVHARGIDLVPVFIDHARHTYPGVTFEVGTVDALDAETGSLGGVLSWYSLIHHEPGDIHRPLQEFARVLAPGGSLLLGFFEGPSVERLDHAVTPAYRWSVGELSEHLAHAGFAVTETHTRTGAGYRPHGAIVAHRTADD